MLSVPLRLAVSRLLVVSAESVTRVVTVEGTGDVTSVVDGGVVERKGPEIGIGAKC